MSERAGNIADIRLAVEKAEPAEAPAPKAKAETAKKKNKKQEGGFAPEVPADLPIECLGTCDGKFYYIDGLKQLRGLTARDHSRGEIVALFARHEDYLFEKWHRWGKDGEPASGIQADVVADVLKIACSKAGVIDIGAQLRGSGSWADEDGGLVLHLGDTIWMRGEYKAPGKYGHYIYPAMAPTLRPHAVKQSPAAGEELLSLIGTWNWAHPVAARIMLGWIVQGFVAGALRWRVHITADGEAGAGKSTLHKLAEGIFGNWGLAASNVTPASIYQLMQGRAQPLMLDEFEAGENPQRKQGIWEVLRQANSGGVTLRGGDDHKGHRFSIQFPAFLSAIVNVGITPQDETRAIRVQLQPLEEGSIAPNLAPARMRELGARLMRRMIDQWALFAETLECYRTQLALTAGFNDRLQDTYGTILACAHMVLYDGRPYLEDFKPLCEELAAMVAPARAEAESDQVRCLQHLLNMTIDRGAGPKRVVADWIRQCRAMDPDYYNTPNHELRKEAGHALGAVGLRFDDKDGHATLFIANAHPGLVRIFADSPWPGRVGGNGSWKDVLRRLPHAAVDGPVKINGGIHRGTRVRLDDFIDWNESC